MADLGWAPIYHGPQGSSAGVGLAIQRMKGMQELEALKAQEAARTREIQAQGEEARKTGQANVEARATSEESTARPALEALLAGNPTWASRLGISAQEVPGPMGQGPVESVKQYQVPQGSARSLLPIARGEIQQEAIGQRTIEAELAKLRAENDMYKERLGLSTQAYQGMRGGGQPGQPGGPATRLRTGIDSRGNLTFSETDVPVHPMDEWLPNGGSWTTATPEERQMARVAKSKHEVDLAKQKVISIMEGKNQAPVPPNQYLNWIDRDSGQTGATFALDFERQNGRAPNQQDMFEAGLKFYKNPGDFIKQDDITRILDFHGKRVHQLVDQTQIPDPRTGQTVPYLPRQTGNAVQDRLNAEVSLRARQALGPTDPIVASLKALELTSLVIPTGVSPGFRPGYRAGQMVTDMIGNLNKPVTAESFLGQFDTTLDLARAAGHLRGTGQYPMPGEKPPVSRETPQGSAPSGPYMWFDRKTGQMRSGGSK